jgi:hypothetical protein
MEVLPVFGTWAVGAASSLLGYNQHPIHLSPRFDLSSELGRHLSPNAAIFLSTDPGWVNATLRWNAFSAPTYTALVEVSTEKDIQETVTLLQFKIFNLASLDLL